MGEAMRQWTDQLMDVSGRNQLLFYRDLKVGTLDLGDADPDALDALLRGRKSSISRLFSPTVVPDRLKRARAIRNKSVESLEERGIVTCYLTSGMATWQPQQGKPTPNAPVLLRAVTFTATDAAESDFDLVADPEIQINPVLVQQLSSDFKISLDPDELLELLLEGSFDPDALFERLCEEASRIPGFTVESRELVGTFSYAKLPMVADLKANAKALAAHDVVAAIAGDADARRSLAHSGQEVELTDPDRRPPSDEFLVLDADSSQSYAINAVTTGQSIVISGPPGTGKSQTISNLIASLVARGSSVLFVAEKRAAIAAVVGRLERVGLSDLVLDLHEGVRSRRVLAESLAAGLRAASAVARPDQRALHERLVQRREQLNAHDAAMHTKRSPWDFSAFEVQTALIDLMERYGPAAETRVRLRGAQLAAIDDSTYRRLLDQVQEFAALGGFRLSRADSPWADAQIRSSEQAEAALDSASRLASRTVPEATRALETLIGEAGLTPPRNLAEWTQALALLERVSELFRVLDPAVFGPELAERVAAAAARKWRKSHPAWPGSDAGWGVRRRRVKSARSLWRGPASPSKQQLQEALQEAFDLEHAWRGAAVDRRGPHEPASMLAAKGLFDQLRLELAALGAYVVGTDFDHLDKAELQSTIESLQSDAQVLFKMPRINELNDEFVRAKLGPLVEEMKGRRLDADLAGAVFRVCWHRSLLERVTFEDQALANFQGIRHHELVSTFREADNEHVQQTARRVRRAAAERLVRVRDEHEDQSTLVQAQAQRKRGHLPLRELFRAAPDVMTALKPCWAMSPLVVSQLLPGDRPYFDVVIFDEASQVLPADAIPAILRGRRLVVAGDAQQLPPTSFFSSASDGEQDEQQAILDDGTINLALTSGYESILDVLTAGLGPGRTRSLTWHYRSRDERLIAFSNSWIYDRSLTTFPGILGQDCLSHELVEQGEQVAGQEDSVTAEVERVVDLVLAHAQQRPHESLGVITMGIKHADRIDVRLRDRLSQLPHLHGYFDDSSVDERFFVKNLERVQGDERDAIILSIGYGKSG
ncbi:MAG: AAA domain-containing protein, partial [Janthinobacterium lividum]